MTITLSYEIKDLFKEEVVNSLLDSINKDLGYDEDITEICVILNSEYKFEGEVYYKDGSTMNTTFGRPKDYIL